MKSARKSASRHTQKSPETLPIRFEKRVENLFKPYIVGIGGTTRAGSSPEKALRYALSIAAEQGAETELFDGPSVHLPMYSPESAERSLDALRLIQALRRAHGVILATPCYHGSVSGLLKNALDYVEDMRVDQHPYLDGRAVGLIVCGHGWQSTAITLSALRSIVHALRGWPTPMGVAINTNLNPFDKNDTVTEETAARQITIMTGQVVEFARMRCRAADEPPQQPQHM